MIYIYTWYIYIYICLIIFIRTCRDTPPSPSPDCQGMSGLTWWATAKEGANIERLIHPVPWAALGWWWLEDVGNKSMFFTEIFMKKLKKFMVLLVWTLRTFCRGLLTYWICFFWCILNMFIGNSWVTCWVWKIFQPDAPLRYQSSLMQQRNTRSFFFAKPVYPIDAVVPDSPCWVAKVGGEAFPCLPPVLIPLR